MHTPSTASIEAIDLSNIKTLIEGEEDLIVNSVTKAAGESDEVGKEYDEFEYVLPTVGIVFGRERYGLTNEELALADSTIYIPANDNYSVLNLAQAVNIIGYELFQRQLELKNEVRTGGVLSIRTCDRLANREELDMFLSRLKENLLSRNYKPVSKNNNEIKDMNKEIANEILNQSGQGSPEFDENAFRAAAELRNENSSEYYRALKFRAIQAIFRRVIILFVLSGPVSCLFFPPLFLYFCIFVIFPIFLFRICISLHNFYEIPACRVYF